MRNLLLFWIALCSINSCTSGFLLSHPSKRSFVISNQVPFMSSPANPDLGGPNNEYLSVDSTDNESIVPDESELNSNELTAGNDSEEDTPKDVSGPQPAFVDQLYAKIKTKFEPNNNQILVMEFPGRILDESTYQFEGDDNIYSNTLKPQVVLEEEFRLTNDVFEITDLTSDKGHIVGGPSGLKVSRGYQEALAKLVPNFDDFKSIFSDRMALRNWLLENVEDEIDGKMFNGSRMELYNELNQRYEDASIEWETILKKKLEEAKSKPDPSKVSEALDAYAKFIAREGQQRQDQIAAKFNDLVVRGYYHEVRRMLGYMDVASPSELLEEAKGKMRQTAMLSVDESETIYPVQMQPVSWAKSLRTDFAPEDLLLSPDLINAELMQKLDRKVELESDIQKLTNQPTGDVSEIRQRIRDAQTSQDNATKEMLKNFTEATFLAIKIAYQAYCGSSGLNPNDSTTPGKITAEALNTSGKNKDGIPSGQVFTKDDITKFKDYQTKNIQTQLSLDEANRELAFELEAEAQAESTQNKDAMNILQAQLKELNIAIKSLEKIALVNQFKSPGNNDTVPTNEPIVGEWIDLKFESKKDTASSESNMNSSGSFSKTSVNILFGSYGSSSDKEFSDFSSKYTARKTDIKVGMRLTKVTIDRGGWLDPGVLKSSEGMYRTSDSKFTDDFATYPVAFIIAKDITIQYAFDAKDIEQGARYAHEASESGGGFLCFSHSSGQSSTSSSKSAYTGTVDDTVMIRIPGPQILMWELEKVPGDKSALYPNSGALSDEVKKLLAGEGDSKKK